eukprot:CAMPEP_0174241402 /NCGR_PEP_ID=MMETSP0417-20130205/23247_1 /TAXON_ID=242541 /ORGANISM="Mayorella sp, Strain BSH-02190019" /LENGTH=1008 /DNA_ID=CAMNT_0015320637 /DNA_START=29 /DNA_END=3055 /DNA_ORIENTATION=+
MDRIRSRARAKLKTLQMGSAGTLPPHQAVVSPLTLHPDCPDLNALCSDTLEYLSQPHILKTEGIFRVSGSLLRIKALQQLYIRKREAKEALFAEPNPHVVSGLFKLFLRELEPPLFMYELYPCWVELAAPSATEAQQLEGARQLFRLLPVGNRALAHALFELLCKVTKTPETLMGPSNVAIVFGPPLIRMQEENLGQMLKDTAQINACVRMLIENYEQIFKTPPAEDFESLVTPTFYSLYQQSLPLLTHSVQEIKTQYAQQETEARQRQAHRMAERQQSRQSMLDPRHRAASLIQALWRGYALRSSLRNVDLRFQAHYNEVFRELIRLERNLVLHLTECISNYMVTFRGLCDLPEGEDPLSKSEFQSIFSTAIHVHDFHVKLLADLENEWKFFPVIGDVGSIYANYRNKFVVYGPYIDNMSNAQRTLHFVRSANKNVRTVLLVLQQRSECGGKPLDELLSFPLAVVPERRAVLLKLLAAVVGSSVTEENVPRLVECITLMGRMSSVIGQISDQEETHKLEMIERMIKGAKEANVIVRPNRKFIHRGVLTIASEKRYLFLFNDVVIVTKSLGKKGFDYEFKYVLEIEDCEVQNAPLKHQAKGFMLNYPSRRYLLLAKTPAERDEWIDQFRTAISFRHHGIFGEPLSRLLQREGGAIPGMLSVIERWLDLRNQPPEQMKLFLWGQLGIVPENNASLLVIREAFNNTPNIVEAEQSVLLPMFKQQRCSLLHLSVLMKMYVFELPEPLISLKACQSIAAIGTTNQTVDSYRDLLSKVPSVGRPVLQLYLGCLYTAFVICREQGVTLPFALSDMAMILSSLVTRGVVMDLASSFHSIEYTAVVIFNLIAHYPVVFGVSDGGPALHTGLVTMSFFHTQKSVPSPRANVFAGKKALPSPKRMPVPPVKRRGGGGGVAPPSSQSQSASSTAAHAQSVVSGARASPRKPPAPPSTALPPPPRSARTAPLPQRPRPPIPAGASAQGGTTSGGAVGPRGAPPAILPRGTPIRPKGNGHI